MEVQVATGMAGSVSMEPGSERKSGQVDQEIHRLQAEVEALMAEVNIWPGALAPVLRQEPSMVMASGKVEGDREPLVDHADRIRNASDLVRAYTATLRSLRDRIEL